MMSTTSVLPAVARVMFPALSVPIALLRHCAEKTFIQIDWNFSTHSWNSEVIRPSLIEVSAWNMGPFKKEGVGWKLAKIIVSVFSHIKKGTHNELWSSNALISHQFSHTCTRISLAILKRTRAIPSTGLNTFGSPICRNTRNVGSVLKSDGSFSKRSFVTTSNPPFLDEINEHELNILFWFKMCRDFSELRFL